MSLRVPPAAVFLVHVGLIWLTGKYLEFATLVFPGQKLVALIVGLAGCILALSTVIEMYRRGTTIDPIFPDKASRLLTKGVFRFSRNPIYLALLFMLIAIVVWQGNWMSFLWCFTMVWHLSHFQIRAEEIALQKKFGEHYLDYKRKVRRWI